MITYSVQPLEQIQREQYESLLKSAATKTVFHSLEWMEIYRLFSSLIEARLICAHSNGKLVGAMPITVFNKLGFRAVFSSGFSLYGGPMVATGTSPDVAHGLLESFIAFAKRPLTVLISVQDISGTCGDLSTLGLVRSESFTHALDLPTSIEAFSKLIPIGRRVKSAGKKLEVFRSRSATDLMEWAKLCSQNYRMHGRRPYPSSLYQAVGLMLSQSNLIRFYVAKKDGKIAGGTVLVFGQSQVYSWMTAISEDSRGWRVTDRLLSEVFADAIKEGFRRFDFGASPEDAHGLHEFKEKWGGSRVSFFKYQYQNLIGSWGSQWLRHRRRA